MTDKEIAENFATSFDYTDNSNYENSYQKDPEKIAYEAFLAGLKAGRPKWHDLRENPDDLPETLHPVYAKLDSGTYVFAYCVNGIWHRNDDGIILYHGDGKSEVIAWCEIQRFEDGE